MDPIRVPQKSIAKFSTASCNFRFRKPTETSVVSLANNNARRRTEPWTLRYSAHFRSEAKKGKVEHVLKKLTLRNLYVIYRRFYFRLKKVKIFYCSGIIKHQNDVINRNIKIDVATPLTCVAILFA